MILSVASGKGGTGKTTVAVNLALSLSQRRQVQFLDCDVEEPNAHFFLKPQILKSQEVFVRIPEIIEDKCTYCGRCAEVCAYKAIAVVKKAVLVFPELCHGCGGCSLLCPEKAIKEVGQRIGVMESGPSQGGSFIQGRLDVGQAMSPPLIREIKKNIDSSRVVIIDSPPGTSCPMVESVKKSDFCLLVTEPTPFGLNDLKLSVEALRLMKIPLGVVINRAGISDSRVEEYCYQEDIPVLMTIPFDRAIAAAYSEGLPIFEARPSYRDKFTALFSRVEELIR
jgi:MinD superfamily P-loop ATPase